MILDEEDQLRYQTVGMLGTGGMGTVWEMHDRALNRRIAFKQMHPEFVGNSLMVRRFIREARVLARLEHPGIVPIHEFGISMDDGTPYYTMEKIRGESLQSILDGLKSRNKSTLHRWPLVRMIGAFSRLCETVAFAHEQGTLHRDLKPDNVMLGRFGEVFLVDWGISKTIGQPDEAEKNEDLRQIRQARLAGGGTALLALGDNVFGTPGYLSPEAARGEDTFTDGGSDIFALGAILHQILTLSPPYEGESPEEIFEKARRGECAEISKGSWPRFHLPDGKLPETLAAIAMMALSPNRADRYATAQDLRRDIDSFLQGKPTRARDAGPAKMLQLFVRRNPGATLVGVLAFFTALAILLAGLHLNFQKRADAEKARDLALEKKRALQVVTKAANADRVEAAQRFAELARDRILLGDVNRARDLANAALDLGGEAPAIARSNLVLGLVNVLRGYPELAEPHWALAESGQLMDLLKQAQARGGVINWPTLLEEAGFDALALRQLAKEPEKQFGKFQEYLARRWDPKLWNLSRGSPRRRLGFYRLELRAGIPPEDLKWIQGWPLHHLVLDGIALADLGPLIDLPELRILELKDGHLVRDLSPLSELKKLLTVSVAPLRDSPDFGFDLTPLASLKRLNHLKFRANAQSLGPLRGLKLETLETRRLLADNSLQALSGMPLRSISVENPAEFDSLRGMSLFQFKAGFAETGYSAQDLASLCSLPLRDVVLDGDFDDEFGKLATCRTLRRLETDHLHDLGIWKQSGLQSIHLKGYDHDLSGIGETQIKRLRLSPSLPTQQGTMTDSTGYNQVNPTLYPLLTGEALIEVTLPEDAHVHLENPALVKSLIAGDWAGARVEYERLAEEYRFHPALNKIAEKWLPLLLRDIDLAAEGRASHTWEPVKDHAGHRYQWVKTPMSWAQAGALAREVGGRLVDVDSEEEWGFLEKNFGALPTLESARAGGNNRIWIGSALPGTTRSIAAPVIRNRPGEAPSIYWSRGNLILLPTAPASAWSFIIEWDKPIEVPPEISAPEKP